MVADSLGMDGLVARTLSKQHLFLNNVNHQILDLYPAHNIFSALESRFVFSNPAADFWRFIVV
jgi:hypothetical protein